MDNLERNCIYVDEGNGCWLWKGLKFSDGYGRIRNKGAHRIFYERYVGTIPKGMLVCHICDVKHCVNPDHFFLGTHRDNLQDAARKGRMPRGDKHGTHTHPESLVRGDEHWSRIHPERMARGNKNGARLYPERLARGDRNGARIHPEKVVRKRSNDGRFIKF